jgi:hypothetical protein
LQNGRVDLADLVVRWASTVGSTTMHTVTVPVSVTATTGPEANQPPNPVVLEEVDVLRAAQARKQAHESIQRGDFAAAGAALDHAFALLAPMPAHAAEAAQARADMDELAQGRWSAATSKRLHSDVRAAGKGRRAR